MLLSRITLAMLILLMYMMVRKDTMITTPMIIMHPMRKPFHEKTIWMLN